MPTYTKVDVPRGNYVGWGERKGQFVEGTVLLYDPTGGKDYNKQICPLLEIELTERAASYDKKLNRTNYPAGEVVFLTCGLVSLKRAVQHTEPKRGDAIRIELEDLEDVADGTVKIFGIQIARGQGNLKSAGGASRNGDDHGASDVPPPPDDDEPPF